MVSVGFSDPYLLSLQARVIGADGNLPSFSVV